MKKIFSLLSLLLLCAVAPLSFAFSDLDESHKNYKAITWLEENEIVNGYPDASFKPEKLAKRAEALKMILLGSGIQGEIPQVKPMPDVETDQWFAEFVEAGKNRNIIKGDENGMFLPSDTLNLAEALKMVLETKEIDANSITINNNPYHDVKNDEWFAAYFQYAKDKKILDASENSNVNPSKDMTRGDLAEIMYRVAVIDQYNLDQFDSTAITNEIDDNEIEENCSEEDACEVEELPDELNPEDLPPVEDTLPPVEEDMPPMEEDLPPINENPEDNNSICEDMCGDLICQEMVCMGEGCPCAETAESCPVDCANDAGELPSADPQDEEIEDEFAEDFNF